MYSNQWALSLAAHSPRFHEPFASLQYTNADIDADEEEVANLRRPSMGSPAFARNATTGQTPLRRPSIVQAVHEIEPELRRPSMTYDPRAAQVFNEVDFEVAGVEATGVSQGAGQGQIVTASATSGATGPTVFI